MPSERKRRWVHLSSGYFPSLFSLNLVDDTGIINPQILKTAALFQDYFKPQSCPYKYLRKKNYHNNCQTGTF